jgi:Rrf2 family protein
MELTREADYALRTMLEVARGSTEVTTTAHVSRRRLVPRPFLRKIVPRLTAAGLLRTRRGKRGGLTLARRAEEIDVLAVIDAVSGPVAVNRCVLRPDSCPLQPICPVHEVCRMVRDEMVRLLGSVHLSDMVARATELEALRAQRSRAW